MGWSCCNDNNIIIITIITIVNLTGVVEVGGRAAKGGKALRRRPPFVSLFRLPALPQGIGQG